MSELFYIDLFSGAGGTTTGIHMVNEGVKVVACVNHDTNAIESHKANHPDCIHFIEDVRDLKVVLALARLVKQLRAENTGCLIGIWASLECTNYSKAKGGLPRDADSRTLAYALFMYIEHLQPDYIDIENVREFMSWGPLDESGRPVSKLNGRDYLRWIKEVKSHGYNYDWQLLNAADFGAYTSRERYFGQFAKIGLPVTWPEQTHTKKQVLNGLFESLKPWKAVRDVLDLTDEGESIFTRKTPLVEKSLERIYAGLVKFVAGGEDLFIQKYFSGDPMGKVISVKGPAGTIKTIDGQAPVFIKRYNGGNPAEKVKSVDQPIGSISTNNRHALVKPCFLTAHYSSGKNIHSVDMPCPTVSTKDRFTKVDPTFMVDYQYKSNAHSIDKPAPTLVTRDKFATVKPQFIDQQFGQSKPHGINRPAGAITANPKLNLVTANPWIMSTHFGNIGNSIDAPCPVITANRKHHYLVNPGWGGNVSSVEKPSPVIVARQDKAPVSKVCVSSGRFFALPWFENESLIMKKIRLFMVLYGIIDIKMRMLKIPELLKIQGFPDGYILKGSQTERKKYIGNAVVPLVAKAIIQCRIQSLKMADKIAV